MTLYWTDIETTGLDPRRDKILEIAIFEADIESPFVAKLVFHKVLQHPPVTTGYHEKVVQMHTDSGLWEKCANSAHTFETVEEDLLNLVPDIEDYRERPTIAGSSAHFDLSFLRAWMPRLGRRFSHRVFDVSALKLFAKTLGMPPVEKQDSHRAIDDILESIDHGRQIVAWLKAQGFKSPSS